MGREIQFPTALQRSFAPPFSFGHPSKLRQTAPGKPCRENLGPAHSEHPCLRSAVGSPVASLCFLDRSTKMLFNESLFSSLFHLRTLPNERAFGALDEPVQIPDGPILKPCSFFSTLRSDCSAATCCSFDALAPGPRLGACPRLSFAPVAKARGLAKALPKALITGFSAPRRLRFWCVFGSFSRSVSCTFCHKRSACLAMRVFFVCMGWLWGLVLDLSQAGPLVL